MTKERKPHPRSAAGPFYVTDGCCTACGVPESLSPELFDADERGHCFVKRQPKSAVESQRMLSVLNAQEFDCVRYKGTDPTVLRRLAEADLGSLCDHPPVPAIAAVARVRVVFSQTPNEPPSLSAKASALREALLNQLGQRGRASEVQETHSGCSFSLAWFEDDYHLVQVSALGPPLGLIEVVHSGPIGLSDLIDDCLRAAGHERIEWSTPAGEHRAARPW